MDIDFLKINGTNSNLDYDILKNSIIEKVNYTCKKIEVIVLNNFPVPVLAQANIDLLILVRIPKMDKNYYKIKIKKGHVNLQNLIIAVSIVKEYQNQDVEINNTIATINNDTLIDYEETATKLKWALTNYLADSCNYNRLSINVHPIFWIKNDSNSFGKCVISTANLTFELIENCIVQNSNINYPGYGGWKDNELSFEGAIKNIYEQAGRDSATGFITKKKIDRIQSKFSSALQKVYNSIGSKLVEIKGKAGTGKSSDLLKCMLQMSLRNHRATFLTYNHLLVFDITSQIKSFENQLSNDDMINNKAPTTAYTLHYFFYDLAKKLGVLMLMSEKRIMELMSILDRRLNIAEKYFDQIRLTEPGISLAKLKFYVQNKHDMDEGTKRQALDLLKHMEEHKFLGTKIEVNKLIESFRTIKLNQIGGLQNSNIFISDYHEVLKNIFRAVNNIDGFINDFDITNKFDLLENTMNLDSKRMLIEGSNKMNSLALKKRYDSSIKGIRAGRFLFVDEAQDCHPLERDILFTIFGSKNIVIANGDKEQLVRYSQVCNWHISRNIKIDYYRYSKKSKSFRMKPAIAALANYIAKSFNIDLEIEPLETEDHGTILIERSLTDEHKVKLENMKKLHNNGYRQGCSSYESLLLLFPPGRNKVYSPRLDGITDFDQSKNVVINEFNVIKQRGSKLKPEFSLISEAREHIEDFSLWNTTGNVDKRELSVPGSLSVRSIYYESCRGIEAWSTMCFGLDEFFDHKRNEDDAENYLLGGMYSLLSNDDRKNMYAATWVLMAMTRAIDSCYIEYSNLNSPIVKVIQDFASLHPNYISYLS